MTTTEALLEKVELVNIISVSELRLQRNFELVIKCLQEHAGRLESIERRQIEYSEQTIAQEKYKNDEVNELTVAHSNLEAQLS